MKPARKAVLAAVPLLFLAGQTGSAFAQPSPYLLDTGDTIEMDVYGMPDFKRRMAVDVDGDVALPFAGSVHAAGLSLAGLRVAIATALASAGAMEKPQVTVEIAEYRPFYIAGDVSRPGAIPFRKGLSVRHAVALAGGYDALRFRTENPLMLAPDLRSRHQALLIDLARTQARFAAVQAEIAGKPDFVLAPDVLPKGVGAKVVEDIVAAERQALASRLQEWTKQTAFQRERIAQGRQQVAALATSLEQQVEAAKYQAAAAERTANNVARGIAGVNRGDEERRNTALMKAQETDTRSRLASANTDLATAIRDLDRLDGERRANLAREAEQLSVEREKIGLDVRASAEKLLYAGAIKAQIGRAAEPGVVIHRDRQRFTADADTPVMPGDLVEVTIDPEAVAAATMAAR